MEIKINNNNELIPATLEVVDGVMIVSPKEGKVDISQFKDGDIITCGWDGKKKSYSWTCVLRGDIEPIADNMFIADYCSVDSNGAYTCENGGSDSAKWVRYATEDEKQKLFDALAKEGKAWDAEKKAVVELKWKPKIGETCFAPYFDFPKFITKQWLWEINWYSTEYYNKGWCFKTKEECEEFCQKLNKAIMEVKR
jgi:hypothetical protein